jgi:hypothetical protein
MKGLRATMVIVMLISLSGVAYSQNEPVPTQGEPVSATTAKKDDRLPIQKQDQWQFFLSPYMWIPGINANIGTLKGTVNPVIPWWDAASALFSKTIGLMGRFEAWKGRWGVYLDGYYCYVGGSGSHLGASQVKNFGPYDFTLNKQIHLKDLVINVAVPGQIGPGNITLTPSGSVKYISRIGSLDLGARFLVGTWPLHANKPLPVLSVELLGGPRFNSINQYIRINLSAIKVANVPIDLGRFSLVGKHETIENGSYVISYNNQFVEPFLGVRLGLWLTQKFLVTLKGDVGGFGLVTDDHVDCDLEALLGYRVSQHIYAYAGYKARGAWYNIDQGLVQINLSAWVHGPVVGMTYAF